MAEKTYSQEYTARIAGLTFPNEDGTDRLKILKKCGKGEEVLLVRDPGNPHSKNDTGEMLGYVAEGMSGNITRAIDEEHNEVVARILRIDRKRFKAAGCALGIRFAKTVVE